MIATDREVKVGFEKPRILKMVAEKYIKEFCSCFVSQGLYEKWQLLTNPQSC